ncbi:MAG: sulfatase [Opitutales bacterium]
MYRIKTPLLSLLACALAMTSVAQKQPNIVFVLVDDMPWWGTSVQQLEGDPRSTSIYRDTPHVARLAKNGMTFANAYAAAGMCAPSRASIQTGVSPARHLFSGNGNFGEDAPDEVYYDNRRGRARNAYMIEPSPIGKLNTEFATIGEKLQERGYATAHIGKWHLYAGGPNAHGYDVSDGETSNDEGRPGAGMGKDDPKWIFSMTRRGIDFISEQHRAQRPFYLQLSHYVEHNKQMSLPETLESFVSMDTISSLSGRNRRETSTHGAAVKDLDTSIGMLLDHLDKLDIRENTYFVFTSDNGKGLYNGAQSVLRGDKWWLWEAGIRVPFMIEGPGIAANSRSDINIVGYDLLPTFYEMAGGDAPQLEASIDGKSLMPILAGRDVRAFENRPLFFHYPHLRNTTPHSAIVQGEYKLYTFYEIPDKPSLFNLRKDLGETTNLAPQMPEKASAMQDILFNYFKRVGAYLPKENPDADTSKPRFDPDKIMPPTTAAL